MGKVFEGIKSHKKLARMGNSGSVLFVAIAQVVAKPWFIPTGISEGITSDDYDVDEEEFCGLLESVFAAPIDLLYFWAKRATEMYDNAKGEQFQWGWEPDELPVPVFGLPSWERDPRVPLSDHWIGRAPKSRQGPQAMFLTHSGQKVGEMEEGRAALFVELAQIASTYYKLISPITASAADCYLVEEDPFLWLVEAIVSTSDAWFYPWARYAAGMYEVIKGELCEWRWEPRDEWSFLFPIRLPDLTPKEYKGTKIEYFKPSVSLPKTS